MPIRTKDLRTTYSGGLTRLQSTSNQWWIYPHDPTRTAFDFKLGQVQTIDSSHPKGEKLILLREPITGAYYPPLREVIFDKRELYATPITGYEYWLYAERREIYYDEPTGLASLGWYMDERSTSGISYPTQASKDLALAMAMSRIGESPFMGAVDLGELRETLRFMRKPFGGLWDVLRGYHRKVNTNLVSKRRQIPRKWVKGGIRFRKDEAKYRADIAADTWLEFRYAASPLILSTVGLAETAATQVSDLVGTVHSARGANKVVSSTEDAKNADWLYDGAGDIYIMRRTKVKWGTETKASYVIRYIYYPWMVDAINLARYGISPTQLPSTIYELTRLTYVADWLVNLGTWLKAMEPKPQCKIIDVCYTHTSSKRINVEDDGGSYTFYQYMPKIDGCTSSFKRSYMARSIVTNTLQAPTPRLTSGHLGVLRSLDALSLLWQPSSKIARRYANLIRRRQ